MIGYSLIRKSFVAGLACGILLACCADAQELVPVTSRREVGWGNRSELPVPVNMLQENEYQFPEQQSEELPKYTGGPTGQSEVITQRYPDGKPQVTRQVMQDQNGNFLNHGSWKLFNRRGQVLAEGEFKEGLMDGTWQRWHPADSTGLFREAPFNMFQGPFLSVATFSSGKLDGIWSIFDRFGRKIFDMPYSNGRRDGRSSWFRPNSNPMREVDFKEGQLHGQLVEYDQENKKTRDATFDQGQELITRTTYYFKEQKRAEHSFLGPKMEFLAEDDWWNAAPAPYETMGEELQHGPTREWYRNGQLRLAGQYKEGNQVGSFMWWHANGQKQIEGQFENGTKTGTWSWWHTNSEKAIEGGYDYNIEVGVWTWWNEFGQLEDQRDFSLESLNIENLEGIESDNSDT